jgi:hypothetical protein
VKINQIFKKKKMEFKFFLTTILMCLISLKPVENNESCLEWTEWNDYKLKFSIQFYNSTLESIA